MENKRIELEEGRLGKVKNRAKDRFDQIVSHLRQSEFMERPVIRDLVIKVKRSKTTMSTKRNSRPKSNRKAQTPIEEVKPYFENDLFKRLMSRDIKLDRDLARKIAESVFDHAQKVSEGLISRSLEGVEYIRRTSASKKLAPFFPEAAPNLKKGSTKRSQAEKTQNSAKVNRVSKSSSMKKRKTSSASKSAKKVPSETRQ